MSAVLNNKRENVWLYLIMPVVVLHLVPVCVYGAFYAIASQQPGGISNVNATQPLFWLYLLIATTMWGFAIFAVFKLKREGASLLGLIAPGGNLLKFKWLPALGIFLAFNAIFIAYIGLTFLLTGQWYSYRGLSDWQRIVFITLLPISAGFTEELYWRGFIISRLRGHGQTVQCAIALSAISFSLIHGIFLPDKLLVTFLIGIVSGIYYARERNLLPLIFTHAFVDTWSYGLSLFIV